MRLFILKFTICVMIILCMICYLSIIIIIDHVWLLAYGTRLFDIVEFEVDFSFSLIFNHATNDPSLH